MASEADDYIESETIDVAEMAWEGGAYDGENWGQPDTEPGDDEGERAIPGDTGETSGADGGGEGGTPGGADGGDDTVRPTDWRDEIRTTEQRREYLANVLNVRPGDDTYKNDLRYLGLIASGKRPGSGEKWSKVRITAEINQEKALAEKPPERPEPGRKTGPGNFKRGDYLTATVTWHMDGERDNRTISGTYTLDTERQVDAANGGRLGWAFISAYLNSGQGGKGR